MFDKRWNKDKLGGFLWWFLLTPDQKRKSQPGISEKGMGGVSGRFQVLWEGNKWVRGREEARNLRGAVGNNWMSAFLKKKGERCSYSWSGAVEVSEVTCEEAASPLLMSNSGLHFQLHWKQWFNFLLCLGSGFLYSCLVFLSCFLTALGLWIWILCLWTRA